MAIEIDIVPATQAHARDLGPRLREADREEVWAASGMTGEEALAYSIAVSDKAWAGFADGQLVVAYGVGPLPGHAGIGTPWLLGSDQILRYQVPFLRRCCVFRNKMLAEYATLRNWVDDRNSVSIRWLRWMGFTIGQPEPFGVRGAPFRPFELRRST